MLELTPAERSALAAAQIALFEDRLILEAQPPVDDLTLAKIARRCAGPIPADLVALWQASFGGSLAYDLRVTFGAHVQPLSFHELFYPESDGYRDLWGWIEHEAELAEGVAADKGRAWSGKLEALPFGGFEYLERMYARVAPGPEHGAVVAWAQGLPPAWTFALHADAVAPAAQSVRHLFRGLALESDPATDEDAAGRRMLEALGGLAELGAAGRTASERLGALVRSQILDWRAALADGTIVQRATLRQLAFEHAAHRDDLEIVRRLEALGCSLTESLAGGASCLVHAVSRGATTVARHLLARGVPVTGALGAGADAIDPDLARELLQRGAVSDAQAVLSAVRHGRLETAWVLLAALSAHGDLAARAAKQADEEDETAAKIERGEMGSSQTPAQHRQLAANLRDLADRAGTK
jgi:hypothetical protein